MDIVPFSKIGARQWNEFCQGSGGAWFRHTIEWIDFCLALNGASRDLSFGVFEDGKMLAAVPLITQPIAGELNTFEFGMAGTPIPYPAVADGLPELIIAKMLKLIFKEIDDIAKGSSIAYSRFFIDPLSAASLFGEHRYNPLPEFGFSEISLTTNIVDMSKSEEELFRGVRSRYRSYITMLERSGFTVEFFDSGSISEDIFGIYKEIYFSAAGKVVGTKERWLATYELIKKGSGLLALERDASGRFVSGVIALIYKKNSYYGFGATASDMKDMNGIGHLLQWEIIKYLKRDGFYNYELGWNFCSAISDEVYSDKEINISFFKSGFGGKVLPLYRGEKFYDAKYLRKRKTDLVEKFISQRMDSR